MSPKLIATRLLRDEVNSEIWQYGSLSLFFLVVSISYNNVPYWARLAMSAVSFVTASTARSAVSKLVPIKEKVRRLSQMAADLEKTEDALYFATEKLGIEISYNLHNEPIGTPAKVEDGQVFRAPQVFKAPLHLPPDLVEASSDPPPKGEWLTDDWVNSSKVICAASGAGKSTYLRWEYRRSLTLMKTYLVDPHLRSNHLEDRTWLDTKEEDLKYVAHTNQQIVSLLRSLSLEIRNRLEGKSELTPIHVLIDESDGYTFKEETLAEVFKDFICLIANEARKTKVTVTFVTHSIQKQKTGLDASDLTQINWMIMGNSLATPHSRWPVDLEARTWLTNQTNYQATLDKRFCRAVVIYAKGDIRLEALSLADTAGQ